MKPYERERKREEGEKRTWQPVRSPVVHSVRSSASHLLATHYVLTDASLARREETVLA